MQARCTILVIEDDVATCDLIVEFLSDEGYSVRGVRDATNGYIALRDYFPDLILCDFHLYDSDGLAFARTLQRAGVDVPVVLMTADNRPPNYPDIVNIAYCLLKPFELDELLACVGAHISVSRAVCFDG